MMTAEEIRSLISTIPDPEIPVITITDLGILRSVDVSGEKVTITITPTYSGCPAMKAITENITEVLHDNGVHNVDVNVKDVVMALEWAAASEAAENEVFNVGHAMVKLSHFVGAVVCVIGRETKTLPPGIDRGVRMAIGRGFAAFTRTQMSPSLLGPSVYPHAKARAAFGYIPQYRLLDGMAQMRHYYRAG